MKLLLIIIFYTHFAVCYSQWHIDSTVISDGNSTLINDLPTMVLAPNGSVCNGNDIFYVTSISSEVKYFINQLDENLIYFEANLIESGKLLGYFRRIKRDCSGYDFYVWVNDLIWIYLDESNQIQKKKFYSNGYLVEF